MHKLLLSSILLLCLMFASCRDSGQSYLGVWHSVDSLMKHRPDSALYILEQGCPPHLSASENATYGLLLTIAQNKNKVESTGDSLMKSVLYYYEKHDAPPSLQLKAHYYLGRIYYDLDSVALCIHHLTVARKMAQEINEGEYACLVANCLGNICYNNDLIKEAEDYYKEAIQSAEINNDSIRLAIVLNNVGKICVEKGKPYYKEAEEYLLRAQNIAHTTKSKGTERYSALLLAGLNSYIPNYEQAIYWCRSYLQLQSDTTRHYSSSLMLGETYLHIEQYDSAFHYLNISAKSPHNRTRRSSYTLLSELARKQNNPEMALQMNDSAQVYTDMISTVYQPVETMKNLKDVIYQELLWQKKVDSQRRQFELWLVIGCITLLLLYLLWRISNHRKRLRAFVKETSIIEAQMIKKNNEIARLQNLMLECEDDRIKVAYLEAQLAELMQEKEHFFERMLPVLPSFQKLTLFLGKATSEETNKPVFTEKQWKKMVYELDCITESFSVRLLQQFPLLKPEDVYFCSLLKMGFNYTDIAQLFHRTRNMIYKRRTLVLERMEKDATLPLDDFIRQF